MDITEEKNDELVQTSLDMTKEALLVARFYQRKYYETLDKVEGLMSGKEE